MNRIEAILYDLRHPITALQRAIAYRYCTRFDMILIDRADPAYLPNRVERRR